MSITSLVTSLLGYPPKTRELNSHKEAFAPHKLEMTTVLLVLFLCSVYFVTVLALLSVNNWLKRLKLHEVTLFLVRFVLLHILILFLL